VASSPSPRRILYVEGNEDGSVGGSHQILLDLVRHLDRTRFHPVLLFYQDNKFARILREEGEEVVVWDSVRAHEVGVHLSGRKLAKLRELAAMVGRRRDFLRKERIQLVHLNNSPRVGHDDWLPAARLAGIPIITSARGDADPFPGSGFGPTAHRWLMRRFDRVASVSEYIAQAMRNQGIPAERVVVVHDGVNPEVARSAGGRPREEIRADLGVPEGRVFVCMVGNIRDWKGQHVAVEALTRMDPAERGGLFLVFVGGVRDIDQPYFQELRKRVEEEGLSDVVSFAGSRNDVPDILAATDISVHASTTPEPGGTVVIESMTFGAPVVVASRGGHLDYLEPGLGLIHDVERPEELAQGILHLARNPELRAQMREKGKLRAASFSIEATARKTEALYDELLGITRGDPGAAAGTAPPPRPSGTGHSAPG